MLDSTGGHRTHKVRCVFCPQRVSVEAYKPRVGHDGNSLNLPWFLLPHAITADGGRLLRGRLYTIELWRGRYLRLAEFPFAKAVSPYAYGGFQMLPFGFGLGQMFWVCEQCCGLLAQDVNEIGSLLEEREKMFVKLFDEHKKFLRKKFSAKRPSRKRLKKAC
jgi:hypothetical protein